MGRLQESSDGVTVRFRGGGDGSAGSTASARLVIGTDGAYSAVRQQSLDDGPPENGVRRCSCSPARHIPLAFPGMSGAGSRLPPQPHHAGWRLMPCGQHAALRALVRRSAGRLQMPARRRSWRPVGAAAAGRGGVATPGRPQVPEPVGARLQGTVVWRGRVRAGDMAAALDPSAESHVWRGDRPAPGTTRPGATRSLSRRAPAAPAAPASLRRGVYLMVDGAAGASASEQKSEAVDGNVCQRCPSAYGDCTVHGARVLVITVRNDQVHVMCDERPLSVR